jgi:hypothetical protein
MLIGGIYDITNDLLLHVNIWFGIKLVNFSLMRYTSKSMMRNSTSLLSLPSLPRIQRILSTDRLQVTETSTYSLISDEQISTHTRNILKNQHDTTTSKSQWLHNKYLNDSEVDGISNIELKWMINEMKEDMYKHLSEIKENINKQLN